MAEDQMTISGLAEKADVTPRTIRYYVSEGLLPSPFGSGPQKVYGYEHYIRLRLIKLLQEEDLPLKKIKARMENLSFAEILKLLKLGEQARERRRNRPVTGRDLFAAVLSPKPMQTKVSEAAEDYLILRQVMPDIEPAYEPVEKHDLWKRVALAPGVELFYKADLDEKQGLAVNRLISEAARVFSEQGG